jgi:hypothetical protein
MATLFAGRFEATECVAGTPHWGAFRVIDREGGLPCVLSVAVPPSDPARLARRLGLPAIPGIAPVRHAGPANLGGADTWIVVEEAPSGAPVRVGVGAAASAVIGAGLARAVAGLHAAGFAAGGLHPSVLYAHEGRFTGVAPRHVLLVAAAATEWRRPIYEPTCFSPERLQAEGPPTPEGDVFAIGTIVAWLATGVPPFGASAMEELRSHLLGVRPAGLPGSLAPALAAAMAPNPADRPSAVALASLLSD